MEHAGLCRNRKAGTHPCKISASKGLPAGNPPEVGVQGALLEVEPLS